MSRPESCNMRRCFILDPKSPFRVDLNKEWKHLFSNVQRWQNPFHWASIAEMVSFFTQTPSKLCIHGMKPNWTTRLIISRASVWWAVFSSLFRNWWGGEIHHGAMSPHRSSSTQVDRECCEKPSHPKWSIEKESGVAWVVCRMVEKDMSWFN